MLRSIRRRLTYANLVASLALFFAITGAGVAARAYVVSSSRQIKDGAVTAADVRDRTLTGRDVKDRSLTAADFSGSVQGPAGPQGATGAIGATGERGTQGERGPQGDAGSSDARAVYRDSAGFGATGVLTDMTMATLRTLPAGNWAINAKLHVDNGMAPPRFVRCSLAAPPDVDISLAKLAQGTELDDNATPMAMQLVHSSAVPFDVTLRCYWTGITPPSGVLLHAIKITAIRVGTLTNTAVDG
jgi:hypothetical protein